MSDGMRDAAGGNMFGAQKGGSVDISDRGLAISEFYASWNPGKIGPLLTALYDAGCLERLEWRKYRLVHVNAIVELNDKDIKITYEENSDE